MISQHLRKLREEVEQVKSEEFLERFMLALKSCLPNVPSDKYTIDQCIQVSWLIIILENIITLKGVTRISLYL